MKSKIFNCAGFRPIDDLPLPTSYAYFRVKVTSHVGHWKHPPIGVSSATSRSEHRVQCSRMSAVLEHGGFLEYCTLSFVLYINSGTGGFPIGAHMLMSSACSCTFDRTTAAAKSRSRLMISTSTFACSSQWLRRSPSVDAGMPGIS